MRDKLFYLALLFFVFSYSPASALTSEGLAEKIEREYNSFEDISMEFVQMIESTVFSDTQKVWGRMYMKNPDKFRIQTLKEVITTDGETLWVFSEKNKQVTKSLIGKSKKIFKPNQYLYNFREYYLPQLFGEERIEKKPCYRLVLSPKKTEDEDTEKSYLFIKSLILWVDKESLLVKKLKYQDINDNLVSFVFYKIKTNTGMKDSEFVFEPPNGIEVVDLTR